jgi:hypothetical protein
MIRTFIGGLVGGLILFVLGFIFWATPLGEIPVSHVPDAQSAALQLSLNQNLTPSGTGTYVIPGHSSAQGSVLYGQGPIATVHFNTSGFSAEDISMLLPGLIVALISGLLMAFALAAVGGGGRSCAGTARLVILASLAFCAWEFLASPIFNHFGWRFFIYSFVVQSVTWIIAGLVIARWFLPAAHVEAAPVPAAEPDAPATED